MINIKNIDYLSNEVCHHSISHIESVNKKTGKQYTVASQKMVAKNHLTKKRDRQTALKKMEPSRTTPPSLFFRTLHFYNAMSDLLLCLLPTSDARKRRFCSLCLQLVIRQVSHQCKLFLIISKFVLFNMEFQLTFWKSERLTVALDKPHTEQPSSCQAQGNVCQHTLDIF